MTSSRMFSTIIGIVALGASLSVGAAGIHATVRAGDVQAVAGIIAADHGAVNARNELGSTPLHIAAGNPSPDIVKLLLDKGAAVNVKDNGGATPLHIAAFSGRKVNLELLLAKGADVNAKDKQGRTPRDYAETTLNHEIADILLIKMLATPKSAARK